MDPRLRGDDGQLRISVVNRAADEYSITNVVVTPAKAGAHRKQQKAPRKLSLERGRYRSDQR
jgi:hypothetical protein